MSSNIVYFSPRRVWVSGLVLVAFCTGVGVHPVMAQAAKIKFSNVKVEVDSGGGDEVIPASTPVAIESTPATVSIAEAKTTATVIPVMAQMVSNNAAVSETIDKPVQPMLITSKLQDEPQEAPPVDLTQVLPDTASPFNPPPPSAPVGLEEQQVAPVKLADPGVEKGAIPVKLADAPASPTPAPVSLLPNSPNVLTPVVKSTPQAVPPASAKDLPSMFAHSPVRKSKSPKSSGLSSVQVAAPATTPVPAPPAEASAAPVPILPALPAADVRPPQSLAEDGKSRYYSDSEAGAIIEVAGQGPKQQSVPAKIW